MSNFTNTKIKDTYQRVLQIDNGEIQDGLGLPVDARIQSLESDLGFTGDLDGTATLAIGLTSGDKTIQGNLDVIGKITAIEIYAQYESASIIYSSGSTKFGDTFDDTHQFTGSVSITGSSFSYNGYNVITSNDTGSIVVDSASYATFAATASYLLGSVDSASYALTASYIQLSGVDGFTVYSSSISSSISALSSSFISFSGSYNTGSFTGSFTGNLTGTSSYTVSASHALNADNAISASYALTASYVNPLNQAVIITGSLNLTGSAVLTGSTVINGLTYPTADNGEFSFMQTDGLGNLTLQYVNTLYEVVYNGEATQITKGTPVYISGSQGANSIAYRADAGDPTKMPVVYIAADNIDPADTGRAIALGLITGVDTTGYPGGTEIYVGVGGGWTSARPTGSAIIQVLGYVTKEGNGGQGVVLNSGPANLPNILSGSVWVGNSGSVPTAVPTSSLSVASAVTASFAQTASLAPNYVLTSVTSSMLAPYVLTSQTSSMSVASASYVNLNNVDGFTVYSSSVSTRLTNQENFSSSLDATFATDAQLNAYTASANARLNSLEIESGSIRSNFNSFTSSYYTDSSSFALRISTNTTNIASLTSATSSYVLNSQTGSFILSSQTSSMSVASASVATSASYALTASFALNGGGTVNTGSLLTTASVSLNTITFTKGDGSTFPITVDTGSGGGGGAAFPFSGSAVISGSLFVSSSTTNVLTIQGSGSAQPIFTVQGSAGQLFAITDSLSGSLFSVNDISGLPILEVFSDNTILLGDYQAPTLYTTKRVTSIAGNNVIYSLATSSYDGAFFDYVAKSGSNARAGNIMALWSGTSVNFTETTTTDFGNTSGLAFTAFISGSNLVLSGSTSTANWNIKTIIRSI